jgi:hypothetical protein
MAEDDFGFDQNAPEEEDDFGGNFGPVDPPDDPPDESDDFSIFDVGLFSLLGTIASFFAKSTPLGIGLSIGGRVLDKVAGTESTISDAVRRGVKSDDNRGRSAGQSRSGSSGVLSADEANRGDRRNFEGDDFDQYYSVGDEIAMRPSDDRPRRTFDGPNDFDDDGGPTDAELREQKEREERQASRRRAATTGSVVSDVPVLAAAPGTPSSRVAMAFAGKRRPGTLFATEEGFADVLGG